MNKKTCSIAGSLTELADARPFLLPVQHLMVAHSRGWLRGVRLVRLQLGGRGGYRDCSRAVELAVDVDFFVRRPPCADSSAEAEVEKAGHGWNGESDLLDKSVNVMERPTDGPPF
jgi:hypothetical protein